MNPDDPVAAWRAFRSLWLALAVAVMSSPFVYLGWHGIHDRASGGSPRATFAVGLAVLALAVFFAAPRRVRTLRVTRTGFLVDGRARDPGRWPDGALHAGILRAGGQNADAIRFVAARQARLHLAARPRGEFAEELLRGADALAYAVGSSRFAHWPYAALLVEPGAPAQVCFTPEAARVAAAGTSAASVFVLAGYVSGHEAALANNGAVVQSLGLVEIDPFLHDAATQTHYGGALAALDGGGDLDDLAAWVAGHQSRSGAAAADRAAVPEVDVCLARGGPASDAQWPARLAALFAYRTVAGPRTDLDARVHAVLLRWQDRTTDDSLAAFFRAWRILMAQPALGGELYDDVAWPDALTLPKAVRGRARPIGE
jgi:hypothetical protein